jgi:hypothetical protein
MKERFCGRRHPLDYPAADAESGESDAQSARSFGSARSEN